MDIKGFKINEILVEEKLDIDRGLYLGMIINEVSKYSLIIISAAGGTGIEEIARTYPK